MVIRRALFAIAALAACAIGPPVLAAPLHFAAVQSPGSTDNTAAIAAEHRPAVYAFVLRDEPVAPSIVMIPTGDSFDRPQNTNLIAGNPGQGSRTARHYDPG